MEPWRGAREEMNIQPLCSCFSSGGAVPVNGAVGLGGSGGEPAPLTLSPSFPFVRARLSPSPAVKGRIVAPAASLVLMSPDANLTHGWSLNNHFLLHPLLSNSPHHHLLLLLLLFFFFFFLLSSSLAFSFSFFELMLYIPSPQFPRQLMRYN